MNGIGRLSSLPLSIDPMPACSLLRVESVCPLLRHHVLPEVRSGKQWNPGAYPGGISQRVYLD
jgi:hypothetical protein